MPIYEHLEFCRVMYDGRWLVVFIDSLLYLYIPRLLLPREQTTILVEYVDQ